jgi:hypothetical protein
MRPRSKSIHVHLIIEITGAALVLLLWLMLLGAALST